MSVSKKNRDWYLIEKQTITDSPLDYDNLRAKGIELTQDFSGDIWTDYNLHDPGVTILEYLCYALTDLAYRTNFDIEDILTTESGEISGDKNHFFSRPRILATNPVTTNDFRRLIIDQVQDIHNVWVEPVIPRNPMSSYKGLFKVLIQLNHQVIQDEIDLNKNESDSTKKHKIKDLEDGIRKNVMNCVSGCRNLGEDFAEFVVLQPREVDIKANIKIDDNKEPEIILAEIVSVIYLFLNPKINFYTESELLQKGYSAEEINSGPRLATGYLLEEELIPRLTVIDPRDMARAISGIDGVLVIEDFDFFVEGSIKQEPFENTEDKYLFIDFNKTASTIRLFKKYYKIPVNVPLFRSKLYSKLDHVIYHNRNPKPGNGFNEITSGLQQSNGSFRNLEKYYSIQNLFPGIYKLKVNLEDKGDNKYLGGESAIAQIKQLKAYLMLFEQVIANYLSQLANIDTVFSSDLRPENLYTYFTQPVDEIPGAKKIIRSYNKEPGKAVNSPGGTNQKDDNNEYIKFLREKSETDDVFINRKNRLLDHLLSRFNIVLDEFPLLLFNELYNGNKVETRATSVLQWKSQILKRIEPFLQNRSQAFNYRQEPKRMGGFEQRMRLLLYIGCETPNDNAGTANLFVKELTPKFDKLKKVNSTTTSRGKSEVAEIETFQWEGEELKIVIEPDPGNEKTANEANKNQPGDSAPLVFRKMTQSFFKDGINQDNFKIVSKNDRILLLYKMTDEKQDKNTWQIAGTFNDYFEAVKSRNEFIRYLREKNINSEGFHLVEHILLMPPPQASANELNTGDDNKNFFNFRVTVVLPGWPARFQDDNFKKFIKELFKENSPAHIRLDFIWHGLEEMNEFENIYFEWLAEITKDKYSDQSIVLTHSLVTWLNLYGSKE